MQVNDLGLQVNDLGMQVNDVGLQVNDLMVAFFGGQPDGRRRGRLFLDFGRLRFFNGKLKGI